MDTAVLVEPKMRSGEDLLRELDRARFPVDAAFWYYDSDLSRWRLVIASPVVESEGPIAAYTQVQEVVRKPKRRSRDISGGTELLLDEVSLVTPKDPLVQLLQSAVRTGPGISGIRFTRNAINNIYVEDVYIYRIL